MKKIVIEIAFITSMIAGLIGMAGCDQAGTNNGDISARQINVVATTSMIADVAKVVGGERVSVEALMGPGVDPHLYKASAGDVSRLEGADVIFYNGLHLEAAMGNVLEQMAERARTVAVTDTIDRSLLFTPPQFQGNYDPHVWFDVSMWMNAVDVVRDTLAQMDPKSADLYKTNADNYLEELADLHEYVKTHAQTVPEARRVIITAHDAFNYFGRAYSFEVRGLQGVSTATEAGAADVQALAEYIVEKQIPAIFVESSVPKRNIEALQAAVKSRGFEVTIGGQLFSDALGDPDKPEGTYVGMVRYNIDTIVSALNK
ncbi:MAG: zinc ABC transporter substrate-binding protein [Chloroflexia bacterium]